MLDKDLCKELNIDEFTQWVMSELDRAEDELYSVDNPVHSMPRYIEVRARYQLLKEVRDAYCAFKIKNTQK